MPCEVSTASGSLLFSTVPLSFWGGVDPSNGYVIDEHHPLHAENIVDRIVAIPGSRGSCSGSGLLLELIMTGLAPAALVFCEQEEILVLGALVAHIMFKHSLPLLLLNAEDFAQLRSGTAASIKGNTLSFTDKGRLKAFTGVRLDEGYSDNGANTINLSTDDQSKLAGNHGKAAQVAMQIVLSMARIQGANELISIKQVHIDSCVYHGPSSLLFATTLLNWDARVAVPTTLNAVSVDQRRWQAQGIAPEFGQGASALGNAFMAMGAELSYTCAPYLLDTVPSFGQQVAWAESNAVTFANSVLGSRTQKYPDFLDACIALTGRAPNTGAHRDAGRRPTLTIAVSLPRNQDDSLWPLLGYRVGLTAENDIPWVVGLEKTSPTQDNLKAFSAAFATTSSSPLFHLAGVTPEATSDPSIGEAVIVGDLPQARITPSDLHTSWVSLNTAKTNQVDMICLGNPHFSFTECESLVSLCQGKTKSPDVQIVVTLGRAVHARCEAAGLTHAMDEFGIQLINDTCWCMLQQPVIPPPGSILMTNSAKYAHYAPGLVNRQIHFGSLAECVEAACTGYRARSLNDAFEQD